jgi:hypothetical protein
VGRGVFIKAKCFVMRYWVTHELVHVAQFERFDGMEPTFRQYLSEILTEGYKDSALEKEAHEVALNWLGRDGAFRKRVPYLFQ